MPIDLERLVQPWKPLDGKTRTLLETPIYRIHEEQRRSPRTGAVRPFYIIDCVDWVNVIPITPAGDVVLVAQWRHGIAAPTIEIPAGMIEPGETPEQAAARELREETGYIAGRLTTIGTVRPNSAILSNHCTTVLAENAVYDGPVALDPGEDIAVIRLPLEETKALIADGTIDHALVVAAFYWLYLHEQRTRI